MFGFINDAIKATTSVVEDAVDITLSVATLGEYGELSKANVSRLIATGITIYALSEATGVAVDILEKIIED